MHSRHISEAVQWSYANLRQLYDERTGEDNPSSEVQQSWRFQLHDLYFKKQTGLEEVSR